MKNLITFTNEVSSWTSDIIVVSRFKYNRSINFRDFTRKEYHESTHFSSISTCINDALLQYSCPLSLICPYHTYVVVVMLMFWYFLQCAAFSIRVTGNAYNCLNLIGNGISLCSSLSVFREILLGFQPHLIKNRDTFLAKLELYISNNSQIIKLWWIID